MTKRKSRRHLLSLAEWVQECRRRLVKAVDALDVALYAEEDSPRLDAAEELLDELELWLDENSLEKMLARLPQLPPQARQRQAKPLRYDVQPHKDDPEDYAG